MIFIKLQSQKHYGPRVQLACLDTVERIFEVRFQKEIFSPPKPEMLQLSKDNC